MEILEMTLKVKFYRPSEDELPEYQDEFYVIDTDGKHRIMTYYPDATNNQNWQGSSGSEWDRITDNEVKCWTKLLCGGMNFC